MAGKIKMVLLGILIIALLAGGIYLAPRVVTVVDMYNSARQKVAQSDESAFKNSKTTLVYDDEGNELCKIMSEKELYYLESNEIPTNLKYSFIVMEDKEFYNHGGVDLKAIIRAMIANQKSNQIVQGASTITQQLARNIYLSHEVTWQRKIEEMFIAGELEKIYTKEKILEYYLNNIYFGNGYYGVESAAEGYFSKSVSELTLSEQAFIAAIPNNPSKYNPIKYFDNTLTRRNLILDKLYENECITLPDYQNALEQEITLELKKEEKSDGSIVTYVRHCATESLMLEAGFSLRYNFESEEDYEGYRDLYDLYYTRCQQKLLTGGYSIYTSIDVDLQNTLQDIIDNRLSEYQDVSKDGIYNLQAAATCIDNTTGNVVAIVGSRTQENASVYGLNRAYQSYRQPGSAIKPLLVYAPYMQKGYTPDSMVNDVKEENGPVNHDGIYDGMITLRYALKRSKNTVVWNALRELTPEVGIGFLQQMGFKRAWYDKDNIAASIGGMTYGATTEEMAAGYSTIINDGMYRRPTCIVKMCDSLGEEVVYYVNRDVRVFDTKVSRMVADMLKSTMEPDGTCYAGAIEGLTMGGKTGSTDNQHDKWFCGFSAYYTSAFWLGYDYPKYVPDWTAVSDMYREFMKAAHVGKPDMDFPSYLDLTDAQTETKTEAQTEIQENISTGESPSYTENDSNNGGSNNRPDNGNSAGNGSNSGIGGVTDPDQDAGNVGGDQNAGNVTGGDSDAGNVTGGDSDAGGYTDSDSNASDMSSDWDAR